MSWSCTVNETLVALKVPQRRDRIRNSGQRANDLPPIITRTMSVFLYGDFNRVQYVAEKLGYGE